MSPGPRPTTSEQDAAVYEAVVVPRYSSLFSRLILDVIPAGSRGTILDVGCATGHPSFELLERMGEAGRVIAVDRDAGLVDLARRRAFDTEGKRIFFKVEAAEKLSFGDEVFDYVVSNLVLEEAESPALVLAELRRVLAPAGQLLLTRTLHGTFEEILDMLREIAVRRDDETMLARVDAEAARHPDLEGLEAAVRAAGFSNIHMRKETFRLPYRNAAELMADRLLSFVAFPSWRAVAGPDAADEVFREVEAALDTYFAGGPLSLAVHGALVSASTR